MIIAIDGPAGAGKSTVAKRVAERLGFLYIDTGALYRALTLKVIESGVEISNTAEIIELARNTKISLVNNSGSLKAFLGDRDVSSEIRQPRITKYVSDVARIKEVRSIMLELQRGLGNKSDSVLDGRDIGTVVFPHAEKKFYLDAGFNERVRRRYEELKSTGQNVSQEEVAADLSNRDRIDSTREVAPLKRSEDAIFVDTTRMSIEEVVKTLLAQISGIK